MSYHNRNQNGKSFRNNNFVKKEQPSNLCDVCLKEPFKYKCSKCKNKAFKICSMDCYKQHNEKGEHYVIAEDNKPDAVVEEDKESNEFQYLMQNEKIQSLLKYNTVKYHLHKIYQLLLLDHNSIQEDTIKNRKDLEQVIARYLSCFRQNGVYRNVAIEEFVQTCLEEISNHESKLWWLLKEKFRTKVIIIIRYIGFLYFSIQGGGRAKKRATLDFFFFNVEY